METFVLRVWTPAAGEGWTEQLRGRCEHVGSGRHRVFLGRDELIRFIEETLRPSTVTLPQPASTSEEET